MILYRHTDPRFPFLWEDPAQPAGRWHAGGEGPANYLADTPDGAWAEFLRHEEIKDLSDLATVQRGLWAIEAPDQHLSQPVLPSGTLTGSLASYAACQEEARRLRGLGADALIAPSAALGPGGACGSRVEGGLQPGPARDGKVVVLFGRRRDLVGWPAAAVGRPEASLLGRVRHFF